MLRKWTRPRIILLLSLAVTVFIIMSPGATSQQATPAPRRDINSVLADNDDRLLAISGVAGIYVGLLDDGRTPCLRVMLTRRRTRSAQGDPTSIEGYPVVVEVTGEIRPLRDK